MTGAAEYRFLPWTRRGLAAEVGNADGGTLPARAEVKVGITVTGAGASGVDLTLYGPGDVLGIDTQLIVRTDPRRNASDVEPNYFASIEFDPPDLPWMFTPARPGAQERLRPWLVLVVLDRAVVARPAVTAGAPLPSVTLSAAAAATELPDLAESWAWAHTQVARDDAAPLVTGDDLGRDPELNVSRIVCPRWLQPGRSYLACLVPAFDVGVFRGLTGQQPVATQIAPAWDVAAPAEITLPVYFHWEFATGPAGDFEHLARKLVPFACPPTVGAAPMHVGAAGPGFPVADFDQPGGRLDMEGALQSPVRRAGELRDVAATMQAALRAAVDAPSDHAEGLATGATPPMGPPLYGGWHANRQRVPDSRPVWIRDLNLDPRARASASIGTEVVKENQEDFVHAAWEQVGDVLAANELLNRARLAEEAARRLRARHLETLPFGRLVALTQGLLSRVKLDDLTVSGRLATTSLPDAVVDSAFRRLTSTQRPMMKLAARRAEADLTGAGGFTSVLVTKLAAGDARVDPALGFTPDGLNGLAALDGVTLRGDAVDLTAAGLPLRVDSRDLREGRARFAASAAVTDRTITVRDDLVRAGLVDEVHVAQARLTPRDGARDVDRDVVGVLREVQATALANPGASGFLVDTTRAETEVRALDVDASGRIVTRTGAGSDSPPVAVLAPGLRNASRAVVAGTLAGLEPGTLRSPGRRLGRGAVDDLVTIDAAGRGTGVVVRTGGAPGAGPGAGGAGGVGGPVAPVFATNTMPPLVTDAQAIGRFRGAVSDLVAAQVLEAEPATRTLVPFRLDAASTTILATTDPKVMVPRRIATMLRAGSAGLLDNVAGSLFVPETHDRIWAAPDLPAPLYEYLARYDNDRFLPGVDVIPNNAITLLETNNHFIEGFMVGVNHEMNRELLWRGYPTDQRGTPFRHFWAWLDGGADIEPTHTWPGATGLGSNTRGGAQGNLVLLVRGELLRRYPNTVIYAWRAENGALKDPPGPTDIERPVFAGRFDPDFSFVGFALTDADLAGDGWFFVLQEQPTEPRFGLDDTGAATPGPLGSWSDASWQHTGVAPGAHLAAGTGPLAGRTFGGVTWTTNAAHLAAITIQKPVRVAVLSRYLVVQE